MWPTSHRAPPVRLSCRGAPLRHTVHMGTVIVFFAIAVIVSVAVLAAVSAPHLRRVRAESGDPRHTSRTPRAES